jgi:putative ABC transport system permease protein
LGLTASDIRADYLKKLVLYLLTGLVFGILSGMMLGQRLAGVLLGFMGAKGLEFTMDPLSTFLIIPVLIMLSVFAAAAVSLKEVKNIKAYECLNTRE